MDGEVLRHYRMSTWTLGEGRGAAFTRGRLLNEDAEEACDGASRPGPVPGGPKDGGFDPQRSLSHHR